MAPQLRIPISAKLDQFEQDMGSAANAAASAARKMATDWLLANAKIAANTTSTTALIAREWSNTGQSVGSVTARFVAGHLANAALLFATYKAVRGAIGLVISDMDEMAKIAEGALKAGVSPEFWQSFLAGARNGKIAVEDLEKALQHAGEAVRDRLNPDWTVWDTNLKKLTDAEKALTDLRELFNTSQRFTALQMFRDAQTNEDRIRATVTGMQELEAIGQRLAALDLAEKVFGAEQAANLRQGKQSIKEFADTMLTVAGDGHAGALVNRTKEVNEELKRATDHLDRAMKPTLDAVASVFNEIKSAMAGIVDLIAKAATVWSFLPRMAPLLLPGAGPLLENAPSRETSPGAGFDEAGFTSAGNVPLPKRRPSGAPKPVATEAAEVTTAFEQQTAAIAKNIATLQADAAAVGMTQAAHASLRVEMRLLEAARAENKNITDAQLAEYAKLRQTMSAQEALQIAGITLTDKQTEAFVRLSDSMRLVQTNLEKARLGFAAVNDAMRFAGGQLIDVIDRATQKGARFGDIMADVLRNVSRQLLAAAITGEGAFAKMLGASSTTGGVGGIAGLLANALKGFGGGTTGGLPTGPTGFVIGGAAEGGPISGPTIVGERGPELFVPDRPGMVVPNDQLRNIGGGNNTINLGGSPVFVQGNADERTLLAMQAMFAQRDKRFTADVAAAMRDLRRRSVRT